MEGSCRLSGDTRDLAWSSNFIADADIRHDEIDRTRYPFGVILCGDDGRNPDGQIRFGIPNPVPGLWKFKVCGEDVTGIQSNAFNYFLKLNIFIATSFM
jgi:hypothetical protein